MKMKWVLVGVLGGLLLAMGPTALPVEEETSGEYITPSTPKARDLVRTTYFMKRSTEAADNGGVFFGGMGGSESWSGQYTDEVVAYNEKGPNLNRRFGKVNEEAADWIDFGDGSKQSRPFYDEAEVEVVAGEYEKPEAKAVEEDDNAAAGGLPGGIAIAGFEDMGPDSDFYFETVMKNNGHELLRRICPSFSIGKDELGVDEKTCTALLAKLCPGLKEKQIVDGSLKIETNRAETRDKTVLVTIKSSYKTDAEKEEADQSCEWSFEFAANGKLLDFKFCYESIVPFEMPAGIAIAGVAMPTEAKEKVSGEMIYQYLK